MIIKLLNSAFYYTVIILSIITSVSFMGDYGYGYRSLVLAFVVIVMSSKFVITTKLKGNPVNYLEVLLYLLSCVFLAVTLGYYFTN